MIIALAQIQAKPGDLEYNRQVHFDCIHQAIDQEADIIFFPELSMTGYEPTLADSFATHPEYPFFNGFRKIADQSSISIGLGMPLTTNGKPHISLFLFQAGQTPKSYSKQLLHADEKPFFSAPRNPEPFIIEVKRKKIVPAICYEAMQEEHLRKAVNQQADVYLASVAKDQKGIDAALSYFPAKAEAYNIPILMVNAVGKNDNFISVGQSCIWNKTGNLTHQGKANQSDLLIKNWTI